MSPSDQSGRRGLQVLVADQSGRRSVGRALAAWLESVAPAKLRGRVTVALVRDARVRTLNQRYRGVDRATDGLSFPARAAGGGRGTAGGWPEPAGEPAHLGDIVIAAGVAERQAREAGHSRLTELRVLALHGLLHLAGYDHERDDGEMARLERRLRRKGGLREGLIERSV